MQLRPLHRWQALLAILHNPCFAQYNVSHRLSNTCDLVQWILSFIAIAQARSLGYAIMSSPSMASSQYWRMIRFAMANRIISGSGLILLCNSLWNNYTDGAANNHICIICRVLSFQCVQACPNNLCFCNIALCSELGCSSSHGGV